MKTSASLTSLLFIERIPHFLGHVSEIGEDPLIELLSIRILTFLHQLLANFPYLFEVVQNAFERLIVSADRVPLDLVDLEPDVDVITNPVLLLLRLVLEVSAHVKSAFVVELREPDVCDLSSLHGPHDNFVMLMKANVLHFELLINLSPL